MHWITDAIELAWLCIRGRLYISGYGDHQELMLMVVIARYNCVLGRCHNWSTPETIIAESYLLFII